MEKPSNWKIKGDKAEQMTLQPDAYIHWGSLTQIKKAVDDWQSKPGRTDGGKS